MTPQIYGNQFFTELSAQKEHKSYMGFLNLRVKKEKAGFALASG